ncbi:MAG: UDP-N-acetylglucosamine 2-epimerase (hydrolyzing) [Desulfobacteraceae bacterium]|nr:UDP-N-acetylglucosamine 2-epimerase (hydrolyzing) [Desulfobacteraceae bacterium]
MKKICIVATTLEAYQQLQPLMDEINFDDNMELTVLSTDSHYSEELNMSYYLIEQDGIKVDENLGFFFNADSTFQNFGMEEYKEILSQIRPEMVVLTGDTQQSYFAGLAALMLDIPLAHIEGGEAPFKEWNDAFRFGLTKLSNMHFTRCEKYRQRIIHFGEHPDSVFNVGALCTEKIHNTTFLSRPEFSNVMGLNQDAPFFLVSYHAFAEDGSKVHDKFNALLQALSDPIYHSFDILFERTRTQGFGKMINEQIDEFIRVNGHRAKYIGDVDPAAYLSAIKHCSLFIGNSSRAIVETPSFKVPMINVGKSQDHRIKAMNIIDSDSSAQKILEAIEKGLHKDFRNALQSMVSPFEQNWTATKIKDRIKDFRCSDVQMKATGI